MDRLNFSNKFFMRLESYNTKDILQYLPKLYRIEIMQHESAINK